MRWLSACPEWQPIQRLAALLVCKKSRYQSSSQDWKNTTSRRKSYHDRTLEAELRQTFILRAADIPLSEEEFKQCRARLRDLCSLLETLVDPELAQGPKRHSKYPLLFGLISHLEAIDHEDSSVLFDLVSGPNRKLFRLVPETKEADVSSLTACNKFIERLFQKSQKLVIGSNYKANLHTWKDSRVRDQASVIFRLLFERFNCDMDHEVLMKVSADFDEDTGYGGLHLLLSSCTNPDNWQETFYDTYEHANMITELHDICLELQQSSGLSQELHLLARKHQLFGAWAPDTIEKPCLRSLEKQSLDELISSGYFKPLNWTSFFNQSSVARYSLKEKRSLAVRLGYCVMDFFDSDLDSKKIHFAVPYGSLPDGRQFYMSFSSKLPSSPEFRSFRPGHPVLLSFVKLLLEMDDGERVPVDIKPQYGAANTQTWASFFRYVQLKESERNDSYLEAILGCLNVHSQLLRVDGNTPDADVLIRKELYQHIVSKLEAALEECSGRHSKKRERSISPPAPPERPHLRSSVESKGSISEPLNGLPHISESKPARKRNRPPCSPPSGPLFTNRLWSSAQEMGPECSMLHSEARGRFCESPHSERHDSKMPTRQFPKALSAEIDDAPPDRDSFEVAIVCALPLEYNAISLLFDGFWGKNGDLYGRARGDLNSYRTGRIGKFDVVLLLLPEMGKGSAASAAASLRSSYPMLRLVLLTGICGGVPTFQTKTKQLKEVLLGDVIISRTVVQYDLGRRYPDAFETKNDIETILGRPTKNIRNIIAPLEADCVREEIEQRAAHFLEQIQTLGKTYQYPGSAHDRLFQATYRHKHHYLSECICAECHGSSDVVCKISRQLSCDELGCDGKYLVRRARLERNQELEKEGRLREAQAPSIFLGRVGSGDTVLKSGEERDLIADRYGILSLEMEGAGIWDELPCIVIKGVCDYADSHKNKKWQDFAAATSASVVKALLERYIKTDR